MFIVVTYFWPKPTTEKVDFFFVGGDLNVTFCIRANQFISIVCRMYVRLLLYIYLIRTLFFKTILRYWYKKS